MVHARLATIHQPHHHQPHRLSSGVNNLNSAFQLTSPLKLPYPSVPPPPLVLQPTSTPPRTGHQTITTTSTSTTVMQTTGHTARSGNMVASSQALPSSRAVANHNHHAHHSHQQQQTNHHPNHHHHNHHSASTTTTVPFTLHPNTSATPTIRNASAVNDLALHNQLLCMLPSQTASFLPYNVALASAALSGVQSSLLSANMMMPTALSKLANNFPQLTPFGADLLMNGSFAGFAAASNNNNNNSSNTSPTTAATAIQPQQTTHPTNQQIRFWANSAFESASKQSDHHKGPLLEKQCQFSDFELLKKSANPFANLNNANNNNNNKSVNSNSTRVTKNKIIDKTENLHCNIKDNDSADEIETKQKISNNNKSANTTSNNRLNNSKSKFDFSRLAESATEGKKQEENKVNMSVLSRKFLGS